MYNITVGDRHPAVICIELGKIIDSVKSLVSVLGSDYVEDGLQDFIQDFSRTDAVRPEDRTVGFVVVNSEKRAASFTFSSLEPVIRAELGETAHLYESIGYSVELDLA